MTDITKTVAPKTDQLNADDFLVDDKPRTIKITGVKMMDSKEQPIAISYEGDQKKPWKPSLGMRRVLIDLWGQEAAKAADKHYVGRMVTLFRDPDVTFGKLVVGGIRISHASHIQGEKKIALTVSKARKVEFIVKPLKIDQQQQAPQQEQTTDTNPPHVKTGLTLVRTAKEYTSPSELRMYIESKAVKDDLATIELANADTHKWVVDQFEIILNKLEIPQ